jgi:hypothetical protein
MRVNVEVVAAGVVVMPSILPHVRSDDWRAIWLGSATAVVSALLLTVLAASLESTVNSPGAKTVAEPVLWAIGSGAGLTLGAVVAAWITRRTRAGALAALIGAIAVLVLVVLAYNNTDLRFEDQLVGTLIIVVLPGYVAAVIVGALAALLARLFRGRRPPDRATGASSTTGASSETSPATPTTDTTDTQTSPTTVGETVASPTSVVSGNTPG